jgi:hypothetical protein
LENIKSRAKKSIAKEKREVKLTGGGMASSERDEGAEAFVSIIPDQMTSLDNAFDDDNYEDGRRFCSTERIYYAMYCILPVYHEAMVSMEVAARD